MTKYIPLIILAILCMSFKPANGQNTDIHNSDTVEFTKIAQLCVPFPEYMRDSVCSVYNMDFSVYANFEYDTITEETRCEALKGNVFSYHPSWDIIYFFYEDFDTEYCRIRVGESWKLIKKKLIYDIHELVPFLCSMEYWAKQTDEFFQEDLKTKIEPSNRHELKCKIKEVKGDWIEIKNGEFKAWVKWKNGSTVFQDCLRFDI